MKKLCPCMMAIMALAFWACSLDLESTDGGTPRDGPASEFSGGNAEPEGKPDTGEKTDIGEGPDVGEKPDTAEETEGDIPKMMINELRTEAGRNKVEFVEFRMLSPGNLSGTKVSVYKSGAHAPAEFVFPARKVAEGELAVLYLRTPEDGEADSSRDAHNFWLPGSNSHLNKNGAVYVEDREGTGICALMVSESADPAWWAHQARSHFAALAQSFFEKGLWKSAEGGVAGPADAVMSAGIGTGYTRSISRDEGVPNSMTSADWYVTAKGGATPGRDNNPKRPE